MKEYIEREALLAYLQEEYYGMHGLNTSFYQGFMNAVYHVKEFPAPDVVSRAAFDQVMWERDIAIQQLREDYGVGLGEKKAADVVEAVRCKDCEYYENGECVNPYIWMSDGAHLWPDEDFYCAKGERRADHEQ